MKLSFISHTIATRYGGKEGVLFDMMTKKHKKRLVRRIEKELAVLFKTEGFGVSIGNREPMVPGENLRILVRMAHPYSEFPTYDCILYNITDGHLYYGTVHESYCPNWNHECEVVSGTIVPLCDKVSKGIPDMMEETFMCFINEYDERDREHQDHVQEPDYSGMYMVWVKDDRTAELKSVTSGSIDNLFAYIANEMQGYRDYRRQDAAEYVILNEDTERMFSTWKLQNPNLLKSGFSKFYGEGIVD